MQYDVINSAVFILLNVEHLCPGFKENIKLICHSNAHQFLFHYG